MPEPEGRGEADGDQQPDDDDPPNRSFRGSHLGAAQQSRSGKCRPVSAPPNARNEGIGGAGLGIAVIIANVTVLSGIGPRLRAVFQSGQLDPTFVIGAVWGDFGSLIAFAVFLSAGLMFRRRPEFHKRLMFLASVSIVGPALGRIMLWPLFAGIHGLSLPTGGMIFFLGGLVIYDLATTKRVHPATILGGAFRLLVWIGARTVAASGFGETFVRGLT
jgi:hypothetical protein